MPRNVRKIGRLDFEPDVAIGVGLPFGTNNIFNLNYETKEQVKDNLRNLVSYARYRISVNTDIKALISADRELPFEYINSAMEALKDAGVYNIVLVSKKKER